MQERANPEILDNITAALDWWRAAGVDHDYLDEPHQWITAEDEDEGPGASRRPRRAPVDLEPEGPPPPPRLDAPPLPDTLEAFQHWWMTEPLLDHGRTTHRVPPQGVHNAKLMILVEAPEDEDRDSLMSGPQGRLLDAMLIAFGLSRDTIYLASALPRAMDVPDWADLGARGLGTVLAHHITLAAPQRLMVLGGRILSLIGHELPQRSAVLREFNHGGVHIPLLASRALSTLLNQPHAKGPLWKAWLDWTT